jgi:hypothetical protein
VGGLFFSYSTRHRKHHTLEFTEATGTMLSLYVWTIFGCFLVLPLFTAFNPLALLYAVLSLTVIRMIPVALSLIRTNFRVDTKLLMGWLGPRGLASVVFTLMAYESFHEFDKPHEMLFSIAGWTIDRYCNAAYRRSMRRHTCPFFVNLPALLSRLISTWRIRPESPNTHVGVPSLLLTTSFKSFSFALPDVEKGPLYLPDFDSYVTLASSSSFSY